MAPAHAQTLAIALQMVLESRYAMLMHSATIPCILSGRLLKHLPKVETRFHCPQAFLSLDFHCRMDLFIKNIDVSGIKRADDSAH